MNKIKVKKIIPKGKRFISIGKNENLLKLFPKGILKNSITMICGKSGSGKTCLINEIVYYLLLNKSKVIWLFTKGTTDFNRIFNKIKLNGNNHILKKLLYQKVNHQTHLKELWYNFHNNFYKLDTIDIIIIDNIYNLINVEIIEGCEDRLRIKKALNILFKTLNSLKKYTTIIIVNNIFEKEIFKLKFDKYDLNYRKKKLNLNNKKEFINYILNKSLNSTIYENNYKIDKKSMSYLYNELNKSYNILEVFPEIQDLQLNNINIEIPKLLKEIPDLDINSDISEIENINEEYDDSSKEDITEKVNIFYKNTYTEKNLNYYKNKNNDYYSKRVYEYYNNNPVLNELLDYCIQIKRDINTFNKKRYISIKFCKYYKKAKFTYKIKDNEIIIDN